MFLRHKTEQVTQQIRAQLGELGAKGGECMQESFLVRQGVFCGRRFEIDGYSAIWFVEEDEIKFYDPDGCVVAVQSPEAGQFSESRGAA